LPNLTQGEKDSPHLRPTGLVDFSKLTREVAARIKKIEQKHAVSNSIEMLTHSATEKSTSPTPVWSPVLAKVDRGLLGNLSPIPNSLEDRFPNRPIIPITETG
jgi:hypothetical protein